MKKDTLKDVLYGAILEMTKNPELFYRSSVGSNYCHWTELGREELMELMESHVRQMITIENDLDAERAKQMTFDTLKKQ
jgi:hypothetical protein